jgi:hypothetical protein
MIRVKVYNFLENLKGKFADLIENITKKVWSKAKEGFVSLATYNKIVKGIGIFSMIVLAVSAIFDLAVNVWEKQENAKFEKELTEIFNF